MDNTRQGLGEHSISTDFGLAALRTDVTATHFVLILGIPIVGLQTFRILQDQQKQGFPKIVIYM